MVATIAPVAPEACIPYASCQQPACILGSCQLVGWFWQGSFGISAKGRSKKPTENGISWASENQGHGITTVSPLSEVLSKSKGPTKSRKMSFCVTVNYNKYQRSQGISFRELDLSKHSRWSRCSQNRSAAKPQIRTLIPDPPTYSDKCIWFTKQPMRIRSHNTKIVPKRETIISSSTRTSMKICPTRVALFAALSLILNIHVVRCAQDEHWIFKLRQFLTCSVLFFLLSVNRIGWFTAVKAIS